MTCGPRFETYKAALDARPCRDGLVARAAYCPRCRGYHVVLLKPTTELVDGHDYHRGKRAPHEVVEEGVE